MAARIFRRSERLAAKINFDPAWLNALAQASPMPDEAPVIKTILSFSSFIGIVPIFRDFGAIYCPSLSQSNGDKPIVAEFTLNIGGTPQV